MAFKIPREQTEDRQINKIQQNIAGVIEPIFNNLTGKFVMTLTGVITSPQVKVSWQRATSTGPITMTIPSVTGTSISNASYLTGLPTEFWPASLQIMMARIVNNGVVAAAVITFTTDGLVRLSPTPAGGAFTTSGEKGIGYTTITYQTAL